MSRTGTIAATVLLLVAAPAGLWADLTKARAQPNLERRARLALDNAALQLGLASQADKSGDWAKTKETLAELGESVDLAYLSLKQTGKNPRNSGQFKNLEIKVRGLLKNLEEFRRTLDFEQREELTPLVEHLRQIQDEVLQSVMTPKEKVGGLMSREGIRGRSFLPVAFSLLPFALLFLLSPLSCSAADRDFLTAAEIDQLREIQEPNARLQLYAGFAKERMALLRQLFAKDKVGRSSQIREAIEEYTSIIDAMDSVSEDALRRRLPLDTGIKAVIDAEKEMLGTLEKISASQPKDVALYKFLLEQAILATEDSLEMAQTDLKTRATEVIGRETKEKSDREASMRPEEVESRRVAEKKEAEQKKKIPTLRRPGEVVKDKP